jgi:hypothetical protein
MTLDEALAVVEAVRSGDYKPSVSSVLKGGISPNDIQRAIRVLDDAGVWERVEEALMSSPADVRRIHGPVTPGRAQRGVKNLGGRVVGYEDAVIDRLYQLWDGKRDLVDEARRSDPSGFRGGAARQLRMDADRARRTPRAPRTPPGPPPETGLYDRLGRRYNPSFRGSRAFHGTLPQATEAALRHPVLGKGMSRSARQAARVAAAKGVAGAAPMAGPMLDYALDPESRTPVQFARAQEEAITGMVPGLVSPSELPPPAVLPPDRAKAVEATQGMVGVAQDYKSGNVTEQEVRAYVANKVAKGDKLPAWAEKITSMKNGRLVIKPVNPRAKARQKAAKRPHNPRVGTKRKYGGY